MRARAYIYKYKTKKNLYTLITYTYILHSLGFGVVILMRARDTPWHAMTRRKSGKFSAEF